MIFRGCCKIDVSNLFCNSSHFMLKNKKADLNFELHDIDGLYDFLYSYIAYFL